MATFTDVDGSVTWGAGVPTRTTWGEIPVVDPGTPLSVLSGFGKHDPLKVWREQPSIRKVVEFTARGIASVPLHGFERVSDNDRRRASGSVLEGALRRPQRFVSGYRLVHDITVDLCMYDMWCVALIDGELQRIPPRLLDITSDFLGNVVGIRMMTPKNGRFDLEDFPLAFDAGWHPAKATGVSPLTTLSSLMDEQARAVKWRTAQWDESAKVSGLLKHPKSLEGQKRERFLNAWREFKSAKAGGTPLLEDGMEYQPVDALKPIDAKDIEGRQLTDIEVASAYHIPPELVGARAGTFANIAAFRQMLFGPTLGPVMESIEQAFNAEIVPALADGPSMYVEFNRESAMAGSFTEQAEVLSRSTGGPWLTRNEARGRANMPALDGADELIVPKNVSEGGLASPADTAPTGKAEGEPWFVPAGAATTAPKGEA